MPAVVRSVGTQCPGITLVESLVALLILSVGLLGIGALFVEGLSSSRSALYRAQAVNLAHDMAERIRANRNAGARGDAYAISARSAPQMQNCAAAERGCTTPVAVAQNDLSRWLTAIRETLPGDGTQTPGGAVSVDTRRGPTRYTITVTWAEPGTASPSTYALSIDL